MVSFLFVLFLTVTGVLNGLGWGLFLLHLLPVLGFGYMEWAGIPGPARG